jgi:vancomycin resistance protein YoaR
MQKRWTNYIPNLLAGAVAAGILAVCPVSAQEEVISDGVFVGEIDVSGMTASEAKAAIQEQVDLLGASVVTLQMGDAEVSTTLGELGLTWENPDVIDEISRIGTTGNIMRRYKEKKDLQNQNVHYEIEYSVDESAERAFVESCSVYNSEPVEGSVYMGDDGVLYVSGGTDGLTLNVDATIGTLNEYLTEWQTEDITVQAEVKRTSPVLTAETLSDMNNILGTATTDYSSSTYARSTNISVGTSKINGTLLMPGESFSVTSAVVPFTAENGYELAPSYESGQVVETYGGGICQVSTTLYNALLKAELEIDARSNHTMTVSYVDPSKDAAIAEGIMDLVFTNNKETPIYIAGSAYGGVLTFSVYGKETRPSNRTIEYVSEVTGRTDASTNVKLVANTEQSAGYLLQTQTAHEGLSAVLWKNVYVDGVLTETTQVNSSYYEASAAIYEVGVATTNQALSAALYSAIAANSLEQVQSVLASPPQEQTETTAQTEAAAQTEAQVQTEAPAQTDAQTQTEAPAQTDAQTAVDDTVTVIE